MVGRFSPALPGSVPLLLATLGCNIIVSALSYGNQSEATAKETTVKATTKVHLHKAVQVAVIGILSTAVGVVEAATG